MTTQLKALFDDRDGADLALLRLRRNGVDYTISSLRAPRREAGGSFMLADLPYGPAKSEVVSPGQMISAVLGSPAVKQRGAQDEGRAELIISVRSEQALRARQIISSASGRLF